MKNRNEDSGIKYRTLGDSAPYGKSKVFFACHPNDHKLYFDKIVKMLFEYENCVIYYEEPRQEPCPEEENTVSWEELIIYLSEMQLIVVPVTTMLLTRPNRTMDRIVPYAREKHIPVLPLMMEPELGELYAKRFGQVQYLETESRDISEIPFDQKLRKYLRDVLIGDETAHRVRKAFAASIFLSYRKKDRSHAQKLMRMIHKNDNYRDIAIWYDEYLVPGENFDSSIEEALVNSKLFTLVITPSILEEGNYVMKYEYPTARKAGKKIMPVEMSQTDERALKESYEDIPAIVDGSIDESLGEALEKNLHEIVGKEKKNDPEHKYLIGLAYLYGIDSEINNEKAVSLITEAAESGLAEAVKTLISMYKNGKGVNKDYKKCADWQARLLIIYSDTWKQSGDRQDLKNLIRALGDYGDALYEQGQIKAAKEIYAEGYDLAQKYMGKDDDGLVWDICLRMGRLYKKEENLKEAGTWFNRSFEIAKIPPKESELIEWWRKMWITAVFMGSFYEAYSLLDAAKQFYEKALDIAQRLVEVIGTEDYIINLAQSCSLMGDIEIKLGKPNSARAWYEKSLEIRYNLTEEAKTEMYRSSLSLLFSDLGDLEESQRNFAAAKKWYEKSFEISEEKAKETPTEAALTVLSSCCIRLGIIAEEQGDLIKAKEWYKKGYEPVDAIAKKTNTVNGRRHLWALCGCLALIEEKLGNSEEAEKWRAKELVIIKELSKESQSSEIMKGMAVSYERQGTVLEKRGNLEIAKEWYIKALKTFELLVKMADTVEHKRFLSDSYTRLGGIEERLENLKKAEEWYEKSLDIDMELVDKAKTPEAERSLFVSVERMGRIYEKQGDIKKAKEWYKGGVSLALKNFEKVKTMESYDDLAMSYFLLGKAGGYMDRNYLTNAFKIWKALSEAFPQVKEFAKRRDLVQQLLNEL